MANNMDIVIDVSIAEQTSATYTTSIKAIDEIMNNLGKCVEKIKGEWKGEASTAFSLDHYPKLYKDMEAHINLIKILQKEIASAAQDFNALDTNLKGKF